MWIKVGSLLLLFALFVLTGCKKDKPGIQETKAVKVEVATIAGDGSPSFNDGPVLTAKFHFPGDVVVDKNGIIYVTDIVNHRVRKIENGQVNSFAGNDSFGIVNGIGHSAQFQSPYVITIDDNGNLYTTDDNDSRIRKITPTAFVTIYAGTNQDGFMDGIADSARFYSGNNIVSDAAGAIYVADARNSRIRKINLAGQVSTLAGNGTPGFKEGAGETAQFGNPGGIVIDDEGNLYVADRGNYRIRKISPAGMVSTLTGNGKAGNTDGNADLATFSMDMHDMVMDGNGNIYIADDNRIRKISPSGEVSTIAGSTEGFEDGEGARAKFNYPNGLGIDRQGNIYVADLGNNRIRKISFQ